jgi:hypothetical protein
MKMPKLTYIRFGSYWANDMNITDNVNINEDERKNIPVRLNNVRTIECGAGYNGNEWLISASPNLKHLILSDTNLPSIDSELSKIFNERIERLDIDEYFTLKQLTEINYVYFSNVQYINFNLSEHWEIIKGYANNITNILTNFQNLKTLLIYTNRSKHVYGHYSNKTDLSKLIKYLETKEIMKNYQVRIFRECLLFLKQEHVTDKIEQHALAFNSTKSLWWTIKNYFSNRKK